MKAFLRRHWIAAASSALIVAVVIGSAVSFLIESLLSGLLFSVGLGAVIGFFLGRSIAHRAKR